MSVPLDPGNDPGVPIGEVSRLLGVPMPTLRSWELRYGIPADIRTSGTHRRYRQPELRAIRLMRDQIARGRSASDAARWVTELLARGGDGPPFVQTFLAACIRADPAGMRAPLDEATRLLGLGACIDEVLLPAMHQVGEWWQTGRCEITQEHLATEVSRSWLQRVELRGATRGTPVLLACGPVDRHSIGLEAFAALLRSRGQACRVLGARTTVLTLTAAVLATGAPAVVIVSHVNAGRRGAIESLHAAQSLGARVFYAGNAFVSPRVRRTVPGVFLGDHIQDGVAILTAAIAPGSSPAQDRANVA